MSNHEYFGAIVYANEDLTESYGKVTRKFTDTDGRVSFETDQGFAFTSWDVESFDCDNTIVLYED